MPLALLLSLQAGAPPTPVALAPVDVDIAALARTRRCAPGTGAEIVVCGRREPGGGYPMEEMARRYERGPLAAEIGIGGGATAAATLEQAPLDRGAVSNRVMIRVRIPF